MRKLKDGSFAEELQSAVSLEVYTKCPSKWKLYDSETGQWYEGTNNLKIGTQWKKINPYYSALGQDPNG